MRRSALAISILMTSVSVSCGESLGSDNKSNDATARPSAETTELSSIDNPIKLGTAIDTEGWSQLVVDVLGRLPAEIAEQYDFQYDPSFDYVLVGFRGVNANGKKSNFYATVSACEGSGSVGSDGVFRSVVLGWPDTNAATGINVITTSDDEVLDGFKDIGVAIYKVKRGDKDAVLMSQSKHCGYELDLVVALGDISKVPLLR